MKLKDKFAKSALGFSKALGRFPLTAAFLVVIAVSISLMINNENLELDKYIATATVGAFISVVLEMIYERFGTKSSHKYMSILAALIITAVYYLLIMGSAEIGMEIITRTGVFVLALIVGFLWVPSIKSKVTFNETFMAGFKAFFIAALFSSVLMAGVSLILGATDLLLFDISEDLYAHTSNIILVLFAAMYFLSLIPRYPDGAEKATSCPKFLEILISYIVVPLASIFTLILMIYIVMNISGSFWRNDLLEVMLVSYVVVVIVIYILAAGIENIMARLFRMIFPKILVAIVLFQTVNSFMRIGSYGLTYGRYYVILFGIFALISGIVFSLKPVEKNGLSAMALIICVAVSLVPPVDAFNLSKASQMNVLEETLVEYDMLKDGKIIPRDDLDEDTEERITESTEYLYRMEYLDEVEYLDDDFKYYEDFKEVFGFSRYEKIDKVEGEDIHIYTNINDAIDIEGYDFMVFTHIGYSDDNDGIYSEYEYGEYYIDIFSESGDLKIAVRDDKGNDLISITGREMTEGFREFNTQGEAITIDEAKIEFENEDAGMKIIFQYLDLSGGEKDYDFNAEIYLMVNIK